MKTKKYYWKLVRIADGKFVSSNTDLSKDYRLVYELNKPTIPLTGKLFVFDTRKHARTLKDVMKHTTGFNFKILKVNVENPEIPQNPLIVGGGYLNWNDQIFNFWRTPYQYNPYTTRPPKGTVFVDSVTPFEISH